MSEKSPFDRLARRGDAPGLIGPLDGRLALTTRAYTGTPVFIPGTSAGAAAVSDMANRQFAAGATPRFMTAVVTVGSDVGEADCQRMADGMARAAVEAEVEFTDVATVDGATAQRGVALALTALGEERPSTSWSAGCIRPGDAVILTGAVGRHGFALYEAAAGELFMPPLTSDAATLDDVVNEICSVAGENIRLICYPAEGLRKAVAGIEARSGLQLRIDDSVVPVEPRVAAAGRAVGLSPLDMPTAAAMIVVVPQKQAAETVAAARRMACGAMAAVIGVVTGL